ncbi:hypothetical protein IY145_07365 [Methylosinus sp. H3A]|uniref:hypothetical protein n=1 Tax=Methylosinus sp. H3A TaxID=2785786 RepID=UPI0018C2CE50|nr:hypothetical protein [Methylosinus sp. H3A]MBG0809193.1 hypothetical protein [Methylosinus sp. H3A]
MGFLFKSLVFLGVVFLVIMRDAERRPAPRERAVAARSAAPAAARPKASPVEAETSPVAAARGALAELADEAAGKIAAVARDHCMAHPLDCLQAAEKIGRATAVEPPRRPTGLGAAP